MKTNILCLSMLLLTGAAELHCADKNLKGDMRLLGVVGALTDGFEQSQSGVYAKIEAFKDRLKQTDAEQRSAADFLQSSRTLVRTQEEIDTLKKIETIIRTLRKPSEISYRELPDEAFCEMRLPTSHQFPISFEEITNEFLDDREDTAQLREILNLVKSRTDRNTFSKEFVSALIGETVSIDASNFLEGFFRTSSDNETSLLPDNN